MNTFTKYTTGLALAVAMSIAAGGVAQAQNARFDQPYQFQQTNRSNTAVIMKQVESGLLNPRNDTATTSSGGLAGLDASSTVLICGGSDGGGAGEQSSSSATGNSSCVILNNSTGAISIGQDAQGDQGATSNSSSADKVNEALNSNPATAK
jgi:hypothetical protein